MVAPARTRTSRDAVPCRPQTWQRSVPELAVALEADWPALGLGAAAPGMCAERRRREAWARCSTLSSRSSSSRRPECLRARLCDGRAPALLAPGGRPGCGRSGGTGGGHRGAGPAASRRRPRRRQGASQASSADAGAGRRLTGRGRMPARRRETRRETPAAAMAPQERAGASSSSTYTVSGRPPARRW
jgi:hypothetical protein